MELAIDLVYYLTMRAQLFLQATRNLQRQGGERRRLFTSYKPKYQVIIDRGWSAVKQIMHDVTSNIYDSFVNLRNSKKSPSQIYTNRKPSKMTMQLIKQIHRGFEPLEISAKRWMFQMEDQSQKQKKDVDQILFNQELFNSRDNQVEPKRKKIFTIIQKKIENPKPFEMVLWKNAEDNITVSKKKLEEIQKQEKQKQEKLKSDILNSSQAKPTEEKLDETNKIVQIKQSGPAVTDQKKSNEQPKPKQHSNTINGGAAQDISNKQIFNSPAKIILTSGLIIENKQSELNKDKPLDTPIKVDNPFLAPVSKPLSFADLLGFKTDIFGNKNTQTNLSNNNNLINNNCQNNNKLPFPVKNDAQLWLNNRDKQQSCKVELKAELFNNLPKNGPTNNQNNPTIQSTPFTFQQSNPFSQPKPLSVAKKGLAPGQITSATIFKPNQTIQNQSLSKDVSQFSQTFSSGVNSNDRAKQMFSNTQAPSVQPQGLFDIPQSARQNTEKKGRNNRRGRKEKQTRIN